MRNRRSIANEQGSSNNNNTLSADSKTGYAGYYGTALTSCDSPLPLINATLRFLDRSFADYLDFVIWTGDNSRHDNDSENPRTYGEVMNHHRHMFNEMRNLFINRNKTANFTLLPAAGDGSNNTIRIPVVFRSGEQ